MHRQTPVLPLIHNDAADRSARFLESGKRFIRYWLGFVAESKTDFERLDEERLNLLAAIRESCRFLHEWDGAARLAIDTYVYLHSRGHWDEIEDVCELLLTEARSESDTKQSIDLMLNRATIARIRGDYGYAADLYSEVVKLTELGDHQDKLAQALWNWGALALNSGRYREAETRLWRCLQVCEALPLGPLIIYTRGQLANIELARGNLNKAADSLIEILPL